MSVKAFVSHKIKHLLNFSEINKMLVIIHTAQYLTIPEASATETLHDLRLTLYDFLEYILFCHDIDFHCIVLCVSNRAKHPNSLLLL